MRRHKNRRHFLTSISATTLIPIPTFAAQSTLRLKAETVTQQILPNRNGAYRSIFEVGAKADVLVLWGLLN